MTDDEILYAITAFALIVGFWIVHHLLSWRESQKTNTSTGADEKSSDSRSRSDQNSASGQPGADNAESFGPRQRQWSEVLNVARNASAEEIRSAYRLAIALYHPDKVASLAPEFRSLANVRSKEINAAYDAAKKLRGFK